MTVASDRPAAASDTAFLASAAWRRRATSFSRRRDGQLGVQGGGEGREARPPGADVEPLPAATAATVPAAAPGKRERRTGDPWVTVNGFIGMRGMGRVWRGRGEAKFCGRGEGTIGRAEGGWGSGQLSMVCENRWPTSGGRPRRSYGQSQAPTAAQHSPSRGPQGGLAGLVRPPLRARSGRLCAGPASRGLTVSLERPPQHAGSRLTTGVLIV